MKRRDWLILAIVLVASLALFLLRPTTSPTGGATQYLRITAPNQSFDLIPLDADKEITVAQEDGSLNVVQVFRDGFRMKESTCKNQDCLHQGEVTTQNVGTRALANQIICLPNKVVLELVNAEEQTVEIAP